MFPFVRRTFIVAAAVLVSSCGGDDSAATDGGGGGRDGGVGGRDGGGGGTDGGPRPDRPPPPAGDLPYGDMGIAAMHPGDVGIGGHSDVIFADDFESYGDGGDLDTNWNAGVYHNADIESGGGPNVFLGDQSLRFTAPAQDEELSNGVARTVAPELDVLFLRFYSKFAGNFDIFGSSHNGGGISAHYFVDGNATPGVPADGMNKYLIEYESWRGEASEPNPGSLNIYIYHPEQRDIWGDHFFPNGEVLPNTSIPGNFGSDFVPRTNVVVELDRWYCYEVMLQANTPGERDGRIGLWLDGELIADFKNLRLRDIPSLTIDRFGLSFHFHSNPEETYKWYDNVVAATSYIGPVFTP
jgi:hypothetical protein